MKAAPALLALVALAAGVGRTTAQPAAADTPVLSTGPALGGDRVFWGETTPEAMYVLLRAPGAGTQVVYRQRSTSRTQDWGADEIAASPSILAFARSWSDCGGGVCGYGGTDVWEGRPHGPFRRLAFAPYLGCASGGVSFDVDGPMIAYSEGFCRRGAQRTRVVLRHLRRGPSVELENAPAKTYCCDAVTIAGHFVAWRAGRAVVVYDLADRRRAYRAALPAGSQRGLDLDLGADGTLVVAIDNRRGITNWDEIPVGRLYRFVPGSLAPRARPLRGRAMLDRYGRRLRFAGGRLLFDRRMTAKTSELVLSDLGGHSRRLASFQPGERLVGDLTMTSERVAWASRKDTEVRRVCNIETCHDVADGAITIWTVRIDRRGSKPHLIARRPYSGLRPLT